MYYLFSLKKNANVNRGFLGRLRRIMRAVNVVFFGEIAENPASRFEIRRRDIWRPGRDIWRPRQGTCIEQNNLVIRGEPWTRGRARIDNGTSRLSYPPSCEIYKTCIFHRGHRTWGGCYTRCVRIEEAEGRNRKVYLFIF